MPKSPEESRSPVPIQPSPALMVHEEESIEDCIAMMQKASVGSVLVVSKEDKQRLVGIFTERDLLNNVKAIRAGNHWNRPIRLVMKTPVKTLPIQAFSEASRVMIENGFRHLPIVEIKRDGSQILYGVISMRDLMKIHVEQREKNRDLFAQPLRKRLPIGALLLSVDRSQAFYDSISGILKSELVKLPSESLLDPEMRARIEGLGALILDIDAPEACRWLELLKKKRTSVRLPFLVILFDPRFHQQEMVDSLQKLNQSRNIAAFAKPVNLATMLQRILPAIESKEIEIRIADAESKK